MSPIFSFGHSGWRSRCSCSPESMTSINHEVRNALAIVFLRNHSKWWESWQKIYNEHNREAIMHWNFGMQMDIFPTSLFRHDLEESYESWLRQKLSAIKFESIICNSDNQASCRCAIDKLPQLLLLNKPNLVHLNQMHEHSCKLP